MMIPGGSKTEWYAFSAERLLDRENQGQEADLFEQKIVVYDMDLTTFLCNK